MVKKTSLALFGISYRIIIKMILSYEQTNNIIDLIRKDISSNNINQQEVQKAYEDIYNYLNYAGGHTPVPNELKVYKDTLSIFQNPYKIISSIKKDFPVDQYFDDDAVKQEIQIIALSWLEQATTSPPTDIETQFILFQNDSIH